MGDRTSIEWTEATWNPVTGCTKVSSGCDHCYASTLAERFRGTPGHYFEHGFDVQLRPHMLDRPLSWSRPRRIFVCSMADLFHDAVPDEYIVDVFAVMALARQHTFQVLTKRHARMRSLLSSPKFLRSVARSANVRDGRDAPPYALPGWPLPNVWLGVSTENQQWADIRIPALLATPAAVRWISAEPLLGPIDLRRWQHERPIGENLAMRPLPPSAVRACGLSGLDWVVAGGESGQGARPMHPDWARSLRDQCAAAGVPFLYKQHGEWLPIGPLYDQEPEDEAAADARMDAVTYEVEDRQRVIQLERDGGIVEPEEHQPTDPRTWLMTRVGKKLAGRKLDGQLHDGYPA